MLVFAELLYDFAIVYLSEVSGPIPDGLLAYHT